MSEYSPELTPYSAQAQTAAGHTQRLVAGVGELVMGLGGVRSVASGVAADVQQMSSGMAASARITHQSMSSLRADALGLSRDFPMATRASLETVQAVRSLGLTARGQERDVGALSKTVSELASATGEAAPAIARDFGGLTREMASLDPARFKAMADVVTTLQARSGAQAGNIVGFAKSIGPMAQAAGVGEAAVLGISTSFAKLGDDGYVAANAVSKMFSDLNRSVRDGSNDMAGYANAVGMTVDQFKALYQANPAQAVAQVVQAVGRMPTGQGQRVLDQLGIDGVRAQRAFLQQAQSGGMMADITTAERAYGSGSTRQASQGGVDTVLNSLTRLGNATDQVAFAFEQPLLHSVNSIVNIAGGISRGAAGVLNTGPVHTALSIGAQAALPLTLARLGGRALSTGAMASFFLRSGPVTGLLAGLRSGRMGGIDQAIESVPRTQAVTNMLTAAQAGVQLGTNPMRANINARSMQVGTMLGALFPAGGAGEGPGLFRRAVGAGVQGGGMLLRSQAELMRLARMDPLERDNYRIRGYGRAPESFLAAEKGLRGDLTAGNISQAQYLRGVGKELDNLFATSGKAGSAIGSLSKGVGSLAVQSALTAGSLTKTVGGGLASRALGFAMNPLTLAAGAAYAGYSMYSSSQGQHARQDARTDSLDIYGTVNAYRDSMGKAGEATMTLSDQMKAAAQTVSAAVTTMQAATTVSGADRSAAAQNRTQLQSYSGTASQVAAQIGMLDLGKLQPSDVQGAKLDLIRAQNSGQLPSNFNIGQALSGVAQYSGQTLSPQQISSAVQGMAAAPGMGGVGFGWQWLARHGHPGHSDWTRLGTWSNGAPQLGKAGEQQLALLQGALGQERANVGAQHGDAYGARIALQDADKAMKAAIKTHNADLVVGMEQQLSRQFTGHSVRGLAASDIAREGFLGVIGNRKIAGTNYTARQILGTAGTSQRVEDPVAVALQNMGSGGEGMARFFSNFGQGSATEAGRKALTAADQAPGDLQKQHDAIMAIVDGGQKAGMSLGDLASQAAKATTTMSDQDARAQVMIGVIAEAQRRLQVNLGGMTLGQRFTAQGQMAVSMAGVTGNSQAAQQARQQGQQAASDTIENERQFMQQRLMAQFNFETQSQRAWRDYHTQVGRETHDFNQQQAWAEADFYRQRGRALRDYNIQIQREIQDAAKSLYDPYQRIAAQPVWDNANLVGNEQEQVTAMRQQVANIKELKRLGITQQAIDQLSLYDPTKAQQVAEMVAELRSDRSGARQLNRVAAARESAAGALVQQAPSFRRSQADFRRQLSDSQKDYSIAVARQNTQFQTQLQRQAHDFRVQLGDAATDIKNADREITGDMTTLQADMNKILHGQQVDWSKSLKNNLRDTINTIKTMTPQLLAAQNAAIGTSGGGGGGGTVAGPGYGGAGGRTWSGGPDAAAAGASNLTMRRVGGKGVNAGFMLSNVSKPGLDTNHMGNPDLKWGKDVAVAPDNKRLSGNARLAQQLAAGYGWGDGVEWAALYQTWNQESGFSTTANNGKYGGIPQGPWAQLKGKSAADQINWGLDYISGRYGDPLGAWAHKARTGWYAYGGIATAPHIGVVAEAGSPEAMIPLNAHGIGVLADALRSYLTPADAAMIHGGGGQSYAIHISHDTYVYDQGQHIHGPVTVKANTPAEWAAQARAQTRKANLTAPRSVRWSRPVGVG